SGHGHDDERLNQNPSFMARQIVDQVVSTIQKDIKESDNKENEHRTQTTITEQTIITRIEGSPTKKAKCEQEKQKEKEQDKKHAGDTEVEIPIETLPPRPDAAIVPEMVEEKKEDDRASNASNQSKRRRWDEEEKKGEEVDIAIEVESPSHADESPKETPKDSARKLKESVKEANKATTEDKMVAVVEAAKQETQKDAQPEANAVDRKAGDRQKKVTSIPRMVKTTAREEKRTTRLPAIGAGGQVSSRVERSTYQKKKVTTEPLTLPPIEKTTVIVEKRVKITTPQVSARSSREAEDADLGCLSGRKIKDITGGWGGSERHLELYNDDDIPARYALPRTVTLPHRLTDRRLYSLARRFERIH
ncbi:hypothetical protein PENTCL1PPCAC_4472, partial [Pristionchus entomophagus]